MNIGAGARGLAMGGAQIATSEDAYTGFWNPAGLSELRGHSSYSLMHAEYFLTKKVEILVERFRNTAFFDMRKLLSVHSELVRSKSRGRQHVLGFHLLYMISLIEVYDRVRRREKGVEPIAVG